MKENNNSAKPNKDSKLKGPSAGLFLNSIIVILLLVIVFLAYSLYTKISTHVSAPVIENTRSAADIVQMEVLNGCGVSGVADNFTSYLRSGSFDVVHTGNYISFDIDNSLVIDRTGNFANALKVADMLGIDRKNVIQQVNNDYFLDVSLIIGRDFNQLKPNKK